MDIQHAFRESRLVSTKEHAKMPRCCTVPSHMTHRLGICPLVITWPVADWRTLSLTLLVLREYDKIGPEIWFSTSFVAKLFARGSPATPPALKCSNRRRRAQTRGRDPGVGKSMVDGKGHGDGPVPSGEFVYRVLDGLLYGAAA